MIHNFYSDFHPTQKNILFFVSQIIALVLIAIFIGNKYEQQIKKRNLIAVNIITIFSIWGILFISCITSDGLLNKFEFNFDSWIAYGTGTFLLFGFINFLLIGFFMGKSLK
jgi:hypothetical protein